MPPTRKSCGSCANYRQNGGWDWGHCHAPLPGWVVEKPLLIANPRLPEPADKCPTYCRVISAKAKPSLDLVEKILHSRRFKGRTADAAKLVLTQGTVRAEACRQTGVDQAALTRMLQKIARMKICPGCGRPVHILLKATL